MRVLLTIRCGIVDDSGRPCRRIMAEVGREHGWLLLRRRGREPHLPDSFDDPVEWRAQSEPRVLEDPPGPGQAPVPVTCDRHPDARPFVWPATLREPLAAADRRARPLDVSLPPV